MNLRNFKDAVKAEAKKALTWVKVTLLAALPFAAEIKGAVAAQLPALREYLPDNIYKAMGAAVVITSIVLSVAVRYRLLKASNEAGNA
jgi:hypothetical protein